MTQPTSNPPTPRGKQTMTTELVPKTQFNSDTQNLQKKIKDVDQKTPNASGLVKKTDLHKKIQKLEIKYLVSLN